MELMTIPARRVMIGDRINRRMVENIHYDEDAITFEFPGYQTETYRYTDAVEVERC